ncbi:hypothetical protein M427DRAFT_27974 [Gonapodya prolifera JEL478]|uniref:DUF4246 domain-containing protein n=1 Tax=Gonapodya prolifera (strain JEL478) TaxID=1344416 RepID=A0A139AW00_GONPJ|nr:hypothetical protein M427DRAFT_27974 [Gonapodya prolifera JEL478]|eukprot:KXS20912.1 hypothetical protein M427DRAFT_27974 [Gonapodya prolifera JEL478]
MATFWQPGTQSGGNSLRFRSRALFPYTRLEREYRSVLNEILIKPNWWTKIQDAEIRGKWEHESSEALMKLRRFGWAFDTVAVPRKAPLEVTADDLVHSEGWRRMPDPNQEREQSRLDKVPEAISFMFRELQEVASKGLVTLAPVATSKGSVTPATASPTSGHGIFVSDDLVTPGALSAFCRVFAPIEEEAFARGDWHNGSTQVLNLVHPSMYCLVYGRTMYSTQPNTLIGDTVATWHGSKSSSTSDISTKYQWLPTDIQVDDEGRISISSYINNLSRPAYPRAYGAIKAVLQAMLPLFERAVDALKSHPKRWILASLDSSDFLEPEYEWQQKTFLQKKYGDGEIPSDVAGKPVWSWPREVLAEYETWADHDGREAARQRSAAEPELPDPVDAAFSYLDEAPNVSFRGKTLQVIFKVATIRLTPENPEFSGGNWHLEGMENEAIAATGLFYYDIENITPSRLTFRNVFNADSFEYPQSDFNGLEQVYGFESELSDNVQFSGQTEARTGRCVVFPNFQHHRVEPFRLLDPAKPGHRRVLAMFLVHPDNRIASSTYVPPQQPDILLDSLRSALGSQFPDLVLRCLQQQLKPMSKEEAKKHVAELSDERSSTEPGGFAEIQNIYLWWVRHFWIPWS